MSVIQERSRFKNATEARNFHLKKAEALAQKYNCTPYELFLKAEHATEWTDDLAEIHYLWRTIGVLNSKIVEVTK